MLCYLGEYITIYQFQRKQQKLRLEEKERQLQSISRDREELKSKLSQLQSLVKGWVHSKDSNSVVEHHQVESEEPFDNNGHVFDTLSHHEHHDFFLLHTTRFA